MYKTFESYIAANNIKENTLVSNYLNDKISYKEFKNDFNKELIKEDVGNWIKEKVLDWSLGIFKSILNMAHSIKNGGEKIFNVLNNVLNYIKKIEEKHPLIFKCVVIMLIIVVISIATAASAYAAKTGDTTSSTNAINMAIGFLDNVNLKDYSSFDIIEAKAYLIKLREGNMGDFPFSEESKKIANAALNVIKQTIEEYKNTHDETTAKALYTWFETGSKMIITNLTQYANTTRITLGSIK